MATSLPPREQTRVAGAGMGMPFRAVEYWQHGVEEHMIGAVGRLVDMPVGKSQQSH